MAKQTSIAWCKSTLNPWIGCSRVSEGCNSCYAEALDKRMRFGGATHWGPGVPRHRTSAANWKAPLMWNKAAPAETAEGHLAEADELLRRNLEEQGRKTLEEGGFLKTGRQEGAGARCKPVLKLGKPDTESHLLKAVVALKEHRDGLEAELTTVRAAITAIEALM